MTSTSTYLKDYPLLNAFGLITNADLVVPDQGGNININYGNWSAITLPNPGPTGTIDSDTGNAAATGPETSAALDQLNTFITNIEAAIVSPVLIPYGTNTYLTFIPGTYEGSNINYNNATLEFDASGNPDAQFLILDNGVSGTKFFYDLSFNLINGAQPNNIIWLSTADTSIVGVVNSGVTGIIIGKRYINIVIVPDGVLSISNAIFNGHIFSSTTISPAPITLNVAAGKTLNIVVPGSTYLSSYPNLRQYAVFSSGNFELVMNAGSTLTIDSGDWYGNPIIGGAGITAAGGAIENAGSSGQAISEFETFVDAILAKVSLLTGTDITSLPTLPETFTPGYYFGSNIDYSGATFNIIFDAEGDPTAQFFIQENASGLSLAATSYTLQNDAQPDNIIWLADNKNSAIGDITAVDSNVPGIFIARKTVTIENTASTGITLPAHIFLISDNATTPTLTFLTTQEGGDITVVVCYAAGTKILTKKGYVAIEDIQIGDSIVTHGSIKNGSITNTKTTFKPAIWTSSFTVPANSATTTPICIKKGALAQGVPFEDLYVSPGHGVTVGNRLVLACTLVNGTTIVQEYPKRSVTYYHIELPGHSAIVANGVLAESYLDDNNRSRFTKRNTLR